MKLLIGLCLLSVAFAIPAIAPITLPEAALPAIEANSPDFERADIRPLIIPQEVIDALRQIGEAPFDTPVEAVHVVDVADNVEAEISADDAPVAREAVIVVDSLDQVVPSSEVAEDAPEPVHFVEIAENIDEEISSADEASPVVVVDHLEELVPSSDIAEDGVAVNFVDIAENIEEEISPMSADSVIVVDHLEEEPTDAEFVHFVELVDDIIDELEGIIREMDEEADAVHFVDSAINMEEFADHADSVIVVEQPLESDVVAQEASLDVEPSKVVVVDEVRFAPIAEEVAPIADAVKVVDRVQYPGKVYDNPLLRSL